MIGFIIYRNNFIHSHNWLLQSSLWIGKQKQKA